MHSQGVDRGNPFLLLLGKNVPLKDTGVDTVGPASGSSHSELKEP